jgi:hypothetical protein
MRVRERLKRMGHLKYILTVGVLRAGFAFGLAIATYDLSLDRSLQIWPREVVKFAFLSLFFGLFDGALGWGASSDKGPPPYPPVK